VIKGSGSASRRGRAHRKRLEPHELTSLDERLGLLLIVRVGIVILVLLCGVFVPTEVGFTAAQIGPISAAYLLVAVGAEAYRRGNGPGRLAVLRAVLPLDAVYLVLVTTPAGGPRSELVVLFAVQLIAVTLLASERAGIRMALWDSFLFVLVPTLSLSGRIGSFLGVKLVAVPPAAETALAIMGFWVVALCTAFFSSVNERELRRSKSELEALADMAARLEGLQEEDEILTVFLRTLVRAFPFRRGALWWTRSERPQGLYLSGLQGSAPRESGSGASEAEVVRVAVDPHWRTDRIAATAWASREAQLVRRLDAEFDPVAAQLMPDARNVVVLPMQIEGGDSGIVLLEYGRNPLRARLPRRTLIMLSQFTAHAALSLRNCRLLAERSRQAAIDGLTGLANRREFDRVLAREVNRSHRSGEALSLVVFDVDHFKQINDSRGHLAGDEVLRAIGQVLGHSVREMDLVARYGGEEFAVILPRCDQDEAVRVVMRIESDFATHPELLGVTLSSGVAAMPNHASDGLALVGAADEALYESKRAGRNRYTVSTRRADIQQLRGGSPMPG
jgi:diguanylate cyclase (GGDEF)-like protein